MLKQHRMELHVHTRYSKDSVQPLIGIYLLCRIKGIESIAITDHNTIKGGKVFYKYFDENSCDKLPLIKGINVIIGSEIMTDSGEIIGLFLKEEIPSGLTVRETIQRIKEQGGVVYLPHPYDQKRHRTVLRGEEIEEHAGDIDCCEAYNGRNSEEDYGKEQIQIVNKYKFQKVIGSDAHTMMEIGRNNLIFDYKVRIANKEDFLCAIQNCQFNKLPCLKIAHEITRFVKVLKMLFGGKFSELYRTFVKKLKRRMYFLG